MAPERGWQVALRRFPSCAGARGRRPAARGRTGSLTPPTPDSRGVPGSGRLGLGPHYVPAAMPSPTRLSADLVYSLQGPQSLVQTLPQPLDGDSKGHSTSLPGVGT